MVRDLRKFRHFFRNAYVLDFDPVLVRSHGERLGRIHDRVAATMAEFGAHLERTMRALASAP